MVWLVVMSLSEFKGDLYKPNIQYILGWVGCGLIIMYIFVHLGHNVIEGIKEAKQSCKRKWRKCKKKCCKEKEKPAASTPL
jgi:hypothetical protein